MTHVSFTGGVNANDAVLTTGTEGFNYLDHKESAADTQTRTFKIEVRGIEPETYQISAANKRLIRRVETDLSIVHAGKGYAVGNTITLGLPGNAQQTIEVTKVNNMGGVERFKLVGTAGTANATGNTTGNSQTGGFMAKVMTAALHTRYFMDTTGLADDATKGRGSTGVWIKGTGNSAQDMQVEDRSNSRLSYVKDSASALYSGTSPETIVNMSKASITSVAGYDYDVDYFPGDDKSSQTLTTYRSTRFELYDHGTADILHVSQGLDNRKPRHDH